MDSQVAFDYYARFSLFLAVHGLGLSFCEDAYLSCMLL